MSSQTSKSTGVRGFLAAHPVFTHEEFVTDHTSGGQSPHTSNSLLAARVANGRILRVRRGLYATVPDGVAPESHNPDPYLLAAKLRDDAVVAYHAALDFHGRAYSVWSRVQYLTAARVRPFAFRGIEYVGVQTPEPVRNLPEFGGGILTRPVAGGTIRVTSLERSVVDLFHAPEHGGGWEEIWRSLEQIEFLDLREVVRFTLLMKSALTVGRVGFFLEQHREQWMVEEKHLRELRSAAPAQPRYLDSRRESGRLVSSWNLIVPEYVLTRAWEEPA